jgi:outer membrane protein TolC
MVQIRFLPFLLILLILLPEQLSATDSLKIMTVQEFLQLVLKNHPVAKQADLLPEKAKKEIRMARGSFDPVIYSKMSEKEFKDKNYYTLWDNYLKLPTWYGIEFKAGYEKNTGNYVNPEYKTDDKGISYAGISVPVGQGLIIDERRSVLRQAKLLPQLAEAERVKIINKLILQASKDYWDWMLSYNKWDLQRKAVLLNRTRFEGIKARVDGGDMAVIDTVEGHIQLLSLELQMSQSELDYRNSSLVLSNHLWGENGEPVEISGHVVPSMSGTEKMNIGTDSVASLVNAAKQNHPDIVKSTVKLDQLKIERRYLGDKFKPKLNFDYNILQSGRGLSEQSFEYDHIQDNYKYGVNFSFPLFIRAERGKYQLNKLKIQEVNLELRQANREIENNIQAVSNDLANLQKQIELQEQLVNSSGLMLAGEQERFLNGESSVFLINSRENYYIANQVKLVELKAKYAKAKGSLFWASGKYFGY